MKNAFPMKKHAILKTYIFDSYFKERKPIRHEDTAAMAALWYFPILDFDLGSLKGKKIKSAVLSLQVVGPNYPFEVELTSITQDWNPEFATYYECDEGKPWAVNHWASEVIMGSGHSFHYRIKTRYDEKTGKLLIPVPNDMVYALISRESYGLGIIDGLSKVYAESPEEEWAYSGSRAAKMFNINPAKGDLPQLEIEYCDAVCEMPGGVFNLEATPVQLDDTIEYASVVLNWEKNVSAKTCCPGDIPGCDDSKDSLPYCFYNIYLTEEGSEGEPVPVERFMVPRFNPEARFQGTEIRFLKPDTVYTFEVSVSNGVYESDRASVKVRTLPAVELPDMKIERSKSSGKGGKPVIDTPEYAAYLADDLVKVNPINGCVFEADNEGYVNGTGVKISEYSGSYSDCCPECGFTLSGARGEKLAFQVVFENRTAAAQEISVEICNAGKGIEIKPYRIWYLNVKECWYPEVAVPLGDGEVFTNPFSENNVPGQVYQSLLFDVLISDTATPGNYDFSVSFRLGSDVRTIYGRIEVIPVRLEKPDFIFEVNGYMATPLYMGRDYYDNDYDLVEEEYYRTALEHNMTINILPYTQTGRVQPRFVPKIGFVDGELHVIDWSEWDAHFARYLDGTYTLEKYGKRIPITHMYLPFHENWPLPIDEYYRIKPERDSYPHCVNDVKVRSTSVENDFLPEYREGIKSVIKDFIRHFDEKGWQHVTFQFYLNNKHYYKEKKPQSTWLADKTIGREGKGTSWWLLDEPNHVDDFDAIRYYGEILKEAQKELNSGYNIKFRLDISGYNYMYDFLDGIVDLPCINARAFSLQEEKARRRSRIFGEINWMYTSLNDISSSNTDMALLVVDTWLKGASGMLPWYNFGRDENFETPANTSGFYPGNRFGLNGPVVSLRIKSARKGMELIRYLNTFRKAFGYGNIQMKAYVAHFLKLRGQALMRYFEDAGTVTYSGDNCTAIEELKRDIIKRLLAKQSGHIKE